MIIDEEEKVEIIDDNEKINFEQNFKPKKNRLKLTLIITGIILAIILIIMLITLGVLTFYNSKHSSVIAKGVFINGVDVSYLSKEDAKAKLTEFFQEKLSNDITLTHNDYTAYIKPLELEVAVNIDATIQSAFDVGKASNIFVNDFQVLKSLLFKTNITPTMIFNEEILKTSLNNISADLPDATKQSGYYIDGNELVVTKGTDGVVIDIYPTVQIIKAKLLSLNYADSPIEVVTTSKSPDEIDINSVYNEVHKDAKDAYFDADTKTVFPAENGIDFAISIDEAKNFLENSSTDFSIPLKVLYPNVSTNELGNEAFPELLAEYSTKYNTSEKDRTTNLRLAANKINNYILLPGETFSYNNVVGERTIAAGYKEAGVYENGQVVQGLGGGICQISTTLFNSVLFANLEIVELHNHQFVPSYTTAGRDATVVYGIKDFKFKNSRNHAIKITCSVSGGIANFKIWGFKEETEYDVNVYANVTSRTSSYIKSSTYRTLKLNNQIISTENIMNATYKVH